MPNIASTNAAKKKERASAATQGFPKNRRPLLKIKIKIFLIYPMMKRKLK